MPEKELAPFARPCKGLRQGKGGGGVHYEWDLVHLRGGGEKGP